MTAMIDYTTMRAGTVTRRDADGKPLCRIARCPKCGRKGELNAGIYLPDSGVVDRYDHRGEDWGWARSITDSCTVAAEGR